MNIMLFSLALLSLVPGISMAANENLSGLDEATIFVRINDITISKKEFDGIFQAAVRHKFYHGRVPEVEIQAFKKQVAEDVVTQTLVHQQAINNGLQPDSEKIKKGIAAYDLKYTNSSEWQIQRQKVMSLLIERLERQNLIEKMESRVKDIAQPDTAKILEYYLENPQKFTEPRRVWVSLILLSVAPSASSSMWDEAIKDAGQLKQRIENGEDFTEIVKTYSDHISAQSGGDLGYLHQGMLDADAQKSVEALAINQLSEPVRVLEGITLFRLNGIQDGGLKPFEEVKQRTASLLYRELQETTWSEYINALKTSASIFVNEKLTVLTSHE